MIAEGRDPPAAFHERPEIHPGHLFYWRSFNDLSTERAVGMGVGPIPFGAIAIYAEGQGIECPDEFERFRNIIAELDGAYIAISAPKDKNEKVRAIASVNDPAGVSAILGRLAKPESE